MNKYVVFDSEQTAQEFLRPHHRYGLSVLRPHLLQLRVELWKMWVA